MTALAGMVLLVATSTLAVARLVEDIVEGRDEIPSLRDVQQAAAEELGAARTEDRESWPSRARLRALVPEVEAGVGTDVDLDVRDSWSGALSRTTTEGRAFGARFGVRWELGDLVFSDAELRASRESLAAGAAIHLAVDRATKIYFDRVEVLILERRAPSLELAFRGARLDGLLRAVTGGRLERRGHRVAGFSRERGGRR